VVSVGNQLDLTIGDYLEHLAGDPGVAIVACYLEGFAPGDGDRFLRAAQRMRARGGLVLWYRGGRTTSGATAAATHTAALATHDLVTRSLGAVSGILEAEALEDFEDLLRLAVLLHHKDLVGNRVGVVSNAGFECVAAADAMGDLTPARFGSDTTKRLRFLLGESGLAALTTLDNPLDLTPMAGPATYVDAATAVLDDPGVDVAVIGCVPFTPALATLPDQVEDPKSLPGYLAALAAHPKPWVAVVDGGRLYDPMADRLEMAGIPVLRAMDRAIRLLGRYAAVRARPHR
jgi:acyl-CoA synthetase (NDP forming)